MDKELKPFSPVYARGVRGQILQGFCWARVRSILSAATASLLVSTLALTIAFPDAIYGALAAFTGVSKVSPVIQGNANLSPLERRLTSVMAAQRTEFLRVNSLIRVRPGAEGPVLKVREEYLVGVFGNEMKHGFKRSFHSAEPVQLKNGAFALGPGLSTEVLEASRRALPLEIVERWEPLVDSNEQLNLPPPVRFPTNPEKQPTGTAIALGRVGDPLKPGVYIYRLDYLVRGAVLESTAQSKDESYRHFHFTPFQPLGLPVSEFDLSVDMSEVASTASNPALVIRAYSLEPQASSQDKDGLVQVIYRDAWTARGQADSPLRFVSSKIDPAAGLQIAVRW